MLKIFACMSTPQGKARAVPNRCCERVGDEADRVTSPQCKEPAWRRRAGKEGLCAVSQTRGGYWQPGKRRLDLLGEVGTAQLGLPGLRCCTTGRFPPSLSLLYQRCQQRQELLPTSSGAHPTQAGCNRRKPEGRGKANCAQEGTPLAQSHESSMRRT